MRQRNGQIEDETEKRTDSQRMRQRNGQIVRG